MIVVLGRVDVEVMLDPVGTKTGERSDLVSGTDGGDGLLSGCVGLTKSADADADVMSAVHVVFHVKGSGADEDVVVGGRCDQDALTHFGGTLEDRMRDERIDVTVEKAVLTDSRDDLELFIVEVVRDDVREQTAGVDDPLGADDASVLGADGEHAVFEDDAADVESAKEFDTVADCALCCADGQFIGGDDACGGSVEGSDSIVSDVGLELHEFFTVDDLEFVFRETVGDTTVIQLLDGLHFLFRESDDQRAVLFIRYV